MEKKVCRPLRAEPNRLEPSRAEPSRAEASPSRAEPRRAEPGRAELRRAEPGPPEPIRAEKCQTEPGRAGTSRVGGDPRAIFFKNISFYNELYVFIPSSKTAVFTMNLTTLLRKLLSRLRKTILLWRADTNNLKKYQNICVLP